MDESCLYSEGGSSLSDSDVYRLVWEDVSTRLAKMCSLRALFEDMRLFSRRLCAVAASVRAEGLFVGVHVFA